MYVPDPVGAAASTRRSVPLITTDPDTLNGVEVNITVAPAAIVAGPRNWTLAGPEIVCTAEPWNSRGWDDDRASAVPKLWMPPSSCSAPVIVDENVTPGFVRNAPRTRHGLEPSAPYVAAPALRVSVRLP